LSGDDFLDFSMPSYGDAVGESTAKAKPDLAPSFANPFSAPPAAEQKEDKAAAAAQKAEDKAAAETKKAEDKAAKEAKAEAKKAEKEARLESEKEKQRLAVERANEVQAQKEAESAAAPVSVSIRSWRSLELRSWSSDIISSFPFFLLTL
jgi:hypothetical protein